MSPHLPPPSHWAKEATKKDESSVKKVGANARVKAVNLPFGAFCYAVFNLLTMITSV